MASFFDHGKEDLNILIVSGNIFDGAYREVINASSLKKANFPGTHLSCEVHAFYDHFDFLDMNSLSKRSEEHESGDYDQILQHVFDAYDIVLWDVPELYHLKQFPRIYFPVITRFDCLSLVVSGNDSKAEDINEVCDFFTSYGLSLKGLLIDSIAITGKGKLSGSRKNKTWWRRLLL